MKKAIITEKDVLRLFYADEKRCFFALQQPNPSRRVSEIG
jgi:hypothetical protein